MQIRNRRYSDKGERLYTYVRVKVFKPGNAGADVVKYHAGKGKGFTAEQIEKILDDAADKVALMYPLHEYRLVPTSKTMFSLVWEGLRVDAQDLGAIETELDVLTHPTPARPIGFSEQRCSLCGGALLTSGVCSFIECEDPMHDLREGLVENNAAREAAV